jgi:alpha-beta hydrolase superfamily lysophospholipase
VKSERYLVDNHAGWRLGLTRFAGDEADSASRPTRPVIVVPGYGMNSFIFQFHPSGPSMVESLVARGLEVWTVDLRGQGRSIRAKGHNRYGLAELAVEDLGAAIAHVLRHTTTKAATVDLVGCSLGTALAFGHLACVPKAPVHAIVALAGLVTWQDVHPLVRAAYGSPKLAGLVRFTNTRRLARFALPVLTRLTPGLLSMYLNEKSTDLSQVSRLVQTVEDPHPVINREIAEWIRRGELVLRGINVSQRLPSFTNPFLCVVANQDGIVLPSTARHTFERIGSTHKELLLVGDDQSPVAHADLFLFKGAQERVFAPTADFLLSA